MVVMRIGYTYAYDYDDMLSTTSLRQKSKRWLVSSSTARTLRGKVAAGILIIIITHPQPNTVKAPAGPGKLFPFASGGSRLGFIVNFGAVLITGFAPMLEKVG